MGSMKGAGALIAALVPIVYCGGMIYYFFGVGGSSMRGVTAVGLGPTVVGLGALGLLFMVPLIVKLVRLSGAPKPGARSHSANDLPDEEAFDADAALARYLARKAAAGEGVEVAASVQPDSTPLPAARPAFGRKIA